MAHGHQGDDHDDGRLEEGRADREEPDFASCFFIHDIANARAPGSFRAHWQGGAWHQLASPYGSSSAAPLARPWLRSPRAEIVKSYAVDVSMISRLI